MRVLGELEARIMHTLWRRGSPATVRDLLPDVSAERPLAYTTVMTVMERLWRKGLLRRELHGRAFAYSPAKTEAEYTAGLMHEVLRSTRDRRAALAHFVQGMRRGDEAELRRLADQAASRRSP